MKLLIISNFIKRKKSILIYSIFILCLVFSCKKEEVPENPYDSIDRTVKNTGTTEPDPNSIVGLHKNIFFPKCANPGCHDGTFEPDYRTVQSTFSTLVYQRVNKVTLDSVKLYTERVVPNNTSDSWLIERLTTQTSEYMPSNGVRLNTLDINHVKNWINAGCPDYNGTLPVKPNLQPNIIGYAAFDASNNRIDTIRLNNQNINPFIVQSSSTITIAFAATDTSDGIDGTDPSLFTVKEIRFSTDTNNFNGSTVISASVYLPQYEAWVVTVPITTWTTGTTVYFRIYVNDGDHPGVNSEFPRVESYDYYKTLYAFYVQ